MYAQDAHGSQPNVSNTITTDHRLPTSQNTSNGSRRGASGQNPTAIASVLDEPGAIPTVPETNAILENIMAISGIRRGTQHEETMLSSSTQLPTCVVRVLALGHIRRHMQIANACHQWGGALCLRVLRPSKRSHEIAPSRLGFEHCCPCSAGIAAMLPVLGLLGRLVKSARGVQHRHPRKGEPAMRNILKPRV